MTRNPPAVSPSQSTPAEQTTPVALPGGEDDVALRLEADQHRAAAQQFLKEGKNGAAISGAQHAIRLLDQANQQSPSPRDGLPQLVDCHRLLGDAWLARRDLAAALAEYQRAIDLHAGYYAARSDSLPEQQRRAILHQKLGDAALMSGDLSKAKAAFETAENLIVEICQSEPDDTAWPRSQAVLKDKRGRVALAQGNQQGLEDAATLFREALAIRQAAVRKLPGQPLPQREVAASQMRLCDLNLALGEWSAAQERCENAAQILEPMFKLHPECLETCHELSVCREKLGTLALLRKDRETALKCFQQSLTLREQIARAQPDVMQCQADLAVIRDKIGDLFVEQKEWQGAMLAYRAAQENFVRLAVADWSNADRQNDLAVCHRKLGDVHRNRGEMQKALREYEQALKIRQRQVMRDAMRDNWQRDLAIIRERIGDTFVRTGNLSKAIKALEAATLPIETLVDRDPHNQQARQDLVVLLYKLWKIALKNNEGDRAKTHLETASRLIKKMEQPGKALPAPVAQAKAKFYEYANAK